MTSRRERSIAHGQIWFMMEEEHSSTTDEAESEGSSRSSSTLSLRYSSSPFESGNSTDADEDSHRVEPYMYEPEWSSSDEADESPDDDALTERLNNTEW